MALREAAMSLQCTKGVWYDEMNYFERVGRARMGGEIWADPVTTSLARSLLQVLEIIARRWEVGMAVQDI
jgi:hypothetical protein